MRRSASAPSRWPAARGRPRALAQRPLPSMMMATWRGMAPPSGASDAVPILTAVEIGWLTSDLHDLFFFGGERLVDLLHMLVGQLLHLVVQLAVLVLGDLAVLFLLLQRFHAVPPDVADGDARLLGVFVRDLGQLGAPLLAELGDRHAHQLAVAGRVEAEAAVADRLLDRAHQRTVPDVDRDHARLWDVHRADLGQR